MIRLMIRVSGLYAPSSPSSEGICPVGRVSSLHTSTPPAVQGHLSCHTFSGSSNVRLRILSSKFQPNTIFMCKQTILEQTSPTQHNFFVQANNLRAVQSNPAHFFSFFCSSKQSQSTVAVMNIMVHRIGTEHHSINALSDINLDHHRNEWKQNGSRAPVIYLYLPDLA